MKNPAKAVATYGVMLSLMLSLGFIERQFPIFPSVPGLRLGLSHAGVLFSIYYMGAPSALALSALKSVLGGLTYAGFTGMVYSLSGGALSVATMLALSKVSGVGFVGVSVAGAFMHTVGQLLASRALLGSWAAIFQSPILLLSSVLAGVVTGVACRGVYLRIRKGQ